MGLICAERGDQMLTSIATRASPIFEGAINGHIRKLSIVLRGTVVTINCGLAIVV